MRRPLHGHKPFARLSAAVSTVAAAAACALAFAPAASAAPTVPAGMFGMNDWSLPTAKSMSDVRGAGIQRWRAGIFWQYVEPNRGDRNWGEYDAMMSNAARQGVSVLAILGGCPAWACSTVNAPPRTPDTVAAMHSYVHDVVARYGPNGTFWAAHPELPRRPITDWQVGNEVDHPDFWKPAPNAAEYASYLAGNSAVIHGVDHGANVVLSGMSDIAPANAAAFLRQLYTRPGFRSSFNTAAVHAYQPDARHVGMELDRVRAVMRANGDNKPLWITEIGWGTDSARLRTPTSEAGQARNMRAAADLMTSCASRWNLQRAYWFAYKDIAASRLGQPDSAGLHTGLFDVNGRAKPAWGTLHTLRAGARLSGVDCQTFAAAGSGKLQTKIASKRRFKRTRRAKLRFVANARGARFQCRLIKARKKARSKRARAAAKRARRWRSCKKRYRTPKLRKGRYQLQVRAKRGHRVDRSPAKATLRLKQSRRVVITVKVARGHSGR